MSCKDCTPLKRTHMHRGCMAQASLRRASLGPACDVNSIMTEDNFCIITEDGILIVAEYA